jgi:pyruvate carboxylase
MAIANFVAHRLHQLFSLEMWGGATFDVAMRFLHEDPFARLRRCAKPSPTSVSRCCCAPPTPSATPRIPITWWPNSFTKPPPRASTSFRIFDSLNWLPNMKASMEAVRKTRRCAKPPSATPATSSTRGATSIR